MPRTAARQPTAPLHVLRPSVSGNGRKVRPAPVPSADYPPGYFTALCVRHGWPYKGWKPTELTSEELRFRQRSMDGHANSRAAVDAGKLHTISLEGTPQTTIDIITKLRQWRPK